MCHTGKRTALSLENRCFNTRPISRGHGRGTQPIVGLSGAVPPAAAYPNVPVSWAGNPNRHSLDTETTGLDHRKDELIELGMVKFDYLSDGRIVGVKDTFSAFNEPSDPIPAEITALTGITDEMVAGHRIDDASLATFVDDAVITIAHNCVFDRNFAERYWPIFEQKAWGCSATEIDWRKHGFAGAQIGHLLTGMGFFHQAHRAVDDARLGGAVARSSSRIH